MSMSDCPKCWDTPCTCGYMGYTVTPIPGPSQYAFDQEKRERRDREDMLLKRIKALENELDALKNTEPFPTLVPAFQFKEDKHD